MLFFHLGKCLIPQMKVYVFIINLSVVYRCFNNCTIEVAAVCQAVAWVLWPSRPTYRGLPGSFSPSPVGVVPLVPNLINSLPECLASDVIKCCVLSRTIVQVPTNSAECHKVNASCNFKWGAWNNWPSAYNNWPSAYNNWPSAWEFGWVPGSSFNQCIL
jgi:hypothetical protein